MIQRDEVGLQNAPKGHFNPQMVYGARITYDSRSNDEKGVWVRYKLEYMIHRNDGTFRNDLDSDSSKKLFFELIGYPDGTVKIDNISYYKR